MGAGDVKLMGAVGGLLGPKGVIVAFLFTAVLGGVYAIVVTALRGHLVRTIKRWAIMLKMFVLTRNIAPVPSAIKQKEPRFCYGAAIALGTLMSIFTEGKI
jgi:prepilin peptidase CpaA